MTTLVVKLLTFYSVFRGARVRDHDPVASTLAVWAEPNPGTLATHPSLDGRPIRIGGWWTALRWPPPTCIKSCNPCTLPSFPGTFASSRPSPWSWTSCRRVTSVEQRKLPRSDALAMQDGGWKRASHLELLPDAKRLRTGRDDQELVAREIRHDLRSRKFLDEGRGPWRKGSEAKGKIQEKGKHFDTGKGRPHFVAILAQVLRIKCCHWVYCFVWVPSKTLKGFHGFALGVSTSIWVRSEDLSMTGGFAGTWSLPLRRILRRKTSDPSNEM